jgi:DNA-binding NtrC family response regulator
MQPNILVIDDEEIILNSLSILFGGKGLRTDTESDPLKALQRFGERDYSIVLVDIVMPKMRGPDLIRKIKEMNPLCNCIVMTAYSNMCNVVECIEAGAIDYITKPFIDTGLLMDIVHEAVQRVLRWKQSFGIGFKEAGTEELKGRD